MGRVKDEGGEEGKGVLIRVQVLTCMRGHNLRASGLASGPSR